MHKKNRKLSLITCKIANTKVIVSSLTAFIFVMVLLYTLLLIGANYVIFSKQMKSCFVLSMITFSPLILSIIQLEEITILVIILFQYPNQLFSLAQISNIMTMVKTILTGVFFLMPLVGLSTLGINKMIMMKKVNDE